MLNISIFICPLVQHKLSPLFITVVTRHSVIVYLNHRFSELILIHFYYQLANLMVRHAKGTQENS